MSRPVKQNCSTGSQRYSRSRSRSRSPDSPSDGSSASSSSSSSAERHSSNRRNSSSTARRNDRNEQSIRLKDTGSRTSHHGSHVAAKPSRFEIPASKVLPVKMSLAPAKPQAVAPKKITVASAFNNDSTDEDEEQMPAECRMRMRNIGRDTPTSSGPNSFGKTKQGFCDSKKMFEKNLRDPSA